MSHSESPHPLDELNRTRLIRDIADVLQQREVPSDVGEAGRTLIGWLARRMSDDQIGQVS